MTMIRRALAALELQLEEPQSSIEALGRVLDQAWDVQPGMLVRRATADCAKRVFDSWLGRGGKLGPELGAAIDAAHGFLDGASSSDKLLSSMETAWGVWAQAEPDSLEAGIAEIAAGCGCPDPYSGAMHVLSGMLHVLDKREAMDLLGWYRGRLLDLLPEDV